MNIRRCFSSLLVSCAWFGSTLVPLAASAAEPPRPKLQIINGSGQTVDVFWLKTDAERVSNGSIAPGKDRIITTTIGHRFAVVGREDKSEAAVTSMVPVQGFRFDPQGKDGVPAFYTQLVRAGGFPIVASAKVNSYALKEAAFLVDMMLAKRPDLRAAMIQSGARMCIMAHDEYTTDLPEWSHLTPKDYRDARARGMGGSETDPYCSVAEENVLGYPGDPYSTECILIHEFAHNIHLRGMLNVDPTFDARLKATYDAAMKAGLWKGKYASVNHHEYFAEGVQSWFDNNRVNDHDHNHVNTRALLIEYDPGLAMMCREVFGDTELKYTKPATRLTGHMAGYEPAKAPTFVWPARLAAVKRQIKEQAEVRDKKANGAKGPIERDLRDVSGWKVHINRSLLDSRRAETDHALELLKKMLDEIIRVVPKAAVVELQKVPLYFSPPYPGKRGGAEFHPDAGWLRDNGRDPMMAKGVEFSGVVDFEQEMNRMPNFALHELAHAYHNRVVKDGFDNAGIKAAYGHAKASGKYDHIERWHGNGRPNTFERAYAMTNPMEYFAENSEAFFSRNDFFPFTREELKRHDPEMFALLGKLWGVEPPRKTGAALKQEPVDFNHPPREYVQHQLQGWEVLVEKQLVDEAPDLAKATLARLGKKLGEIVAALPPASLADLRGLKLFLLYGPKAGAGGRSSGFEFFRTGAAKSQAWLDPRMAPGIVIFNAENFAKLSELWAVKGLVHEFAHARHLESWPENRADIYDTWDRAMKAGLFQTVREEDKGEHHPNYAAQNHMEYFAELSAMYFVGANYFPRNRAGLKAYDPAGYALIESLWGVNEARASAQLGK
jgi:Mlc titration factor MtfA (ptsG expression regulator)